MASTPSATILIVDDDHVLRESLSTYLQDSGYRTISAKNGREGLDQFYQNRPDLVLLDLALPVLGGLEVLARFVEAAPETPVLIVTGMGTLENSVEALRAGAWNYITKPVQDMGFIEHAVVKALERARLIRENREYRELLEDEVLRRTAQLEERNRQVLEKEDRFRSVVDSTSDAIIALDDRGRIISWNKATSTIFGFGNKSIDGMSLNALIPECRWETDKKAAIGGAETGRHPPGQATLEYSGLRGNNTTFPLELSLGTWTSGGNRYFSGIIRDITERKKAQLELVRSAEKFHDMFMGTIQTISLIVEKRDPFTAGHQIRVTELAAAIATEMGLAADRIEGICLGGMIHDIGKISVPSDILNRPGALNEMEHALIMSHPDVGFEIIRELYLPEATKDIVLQHHERLDGSGYPQGLKGDDIALEARIIAVADVVEAISSHRPYRAALGIEAGMEEIRQGRGTLFDKDVVDACLTLFRTNKFRWGQDILTRDSSAPLRPAMTAARVADRMAPSRQLAEDECPLFC